ncbi:carboxylesterase/lipase family protein [Microbacterium koreense]|uniref:Carboxylic ester hydrolase n=1 Tax=Microbacterium koreense TaxID=323761 RepID=A0ABW2ZMQ1_9MICO
MSADSPPLVDTASGRVRGVWRGDSAAFLGIPFAQPPVGDLRFAAPVPVERWEGVRDAVEFGATAQRGDPGETLIPEPSVAGDSTLNVNVFTPAPADDARLPVMVWIHGGGYTGGSPASPWYDGRSFNRDGVVTVTVSYRLGFDGFGHIEGAPSNRAVRDWLAALEWVQRNIGAFGGDPDRVTIAGQSAGGGAVLTLLAMPAAQHLFSAVWALSPALGDIPAEQARTVSAKLANLAGVAPTRAGFAAVSEERLHALQHDATNPPPARPWEKARELISQGSPWGPVIDGDLLLRDTVTSLAAGVGADKPLVIGSTDDEFTTMTDAAKHPLGLVPASLALAVVAPDPRRRRDYLAANTEQRRKGTAAVLGRYVTDAVFRVTVVRVADARGEAPTWVYRFAWASPTRGWALHCLDVPFWFDVLDADGVTRLAGPQPPRALANALHDAATAFVRTRAPGWLAWSGEPGTARVFGGPASQPDVARDAYASVLALV